MLSGYTAFKAISWSPTLLNLNLLSLLTYLLISWCIIPSLFMTLVTDVTNIYISFLLLYASVHNFLFCWCWWYFNYIKKRRQEILTFVFIFFNSSCLIYCVNDMFYFSVLFNIQRCALKNVSQFIDFLISLALINQSTVETNTDLSNLSMTTNVGFTPRNGFGLLWWL